MFLLQTNLFKCSLIALMLLLVCYGCSDVKQNVWNPRNINDAGTAIGIDSTMFINEDSISIGDTNSKMYHFDKRHFNEIVVAFPELYAEITEPPDLLYAKSVVHKSVSINGEKKEISFGSEAGKDEYYALYAYFMNLKNVEKDVNGRKDTLVAVYNKINDIFRIPRSGGSFFGHQCSGRIAGYAAYDISEYQWHKDLFEKKYTICNQKKMYIGSLKQYISDEVAADNFNGMTTEGKRRKMEKLVLMVKELEGLITDFFYLKCAQKFQYTHY